MSISSLGIELVRIELVNPFIASAKKTRDLWFGSTLLRELSAAAVTKLESDSPPFLPGSSLKGILRTHLNKNSEHLCEGKFGSDDLDPFINQYKRQTQLQRNLCLEVLEDTKQAQEAAAQVIQTEMRVLQNEDLPFSLSLLGFDRPQIFPLTDWTEAKENQILKNKPHFLEDMRSIEKRICRIIKKLLRQFLVSILCSIKIRSIDYLINAIHRIFYIPHSTLHMPKDTEGDQSMACDRLEPLFRAIMGMLRLLPVP